VFEIFIDESGVHGDESPVVSAGAFLGSKRSWIDFTKDWNRAKKSLPVYHSVDAANLTGAFKGWSEEKRDKLFIKLAGIISEYRLLSFAIGFNMTDYRKVSAEFPDQVMSEAEVYDMCFHGVVRMVMDFLKRNDDDTHLAFVHEDTKYAGMIAETFGLLKQEYRPTGLMTLAFGGKHEYVPLQAADILAYEANKRTRNPDGKPRRSWTAINPDKNRRHYSLFKEENLRKLAAWRSDFVVRETGR